MGSFVLWSMMLVVVPWGYGLAAKLAPPDLQSMVTGRCKDYISKHPELGNKACGSIWEAFSRAINQGCRVSETSYAEFIRLGNHAVERNKAYFWSGVTTCSIPGKTLLKDTLIGHMLNDLQWCPTQDGKECSKEDCKNAEKFYWRSASRNFAKTVSGIVTVELKGGHYSEGSIFHDVEVPELVYPRVTQMDSRVIKGKGNEGTCDFGAQLQLRRDVEKNGVIFYCVEVTSSRKRRDVFFRKARHFEYTCSAISLAHLHNNPLTFFLLGLVLYNVW
ncbi:ADP-ribosyl cyclase/cyclic ADP-ribose hydrolase 2-like isoform X2 [Lampetra planeri]